MARLLSALRCGGTKQDEGAQGRPKTVLWCGEAVLKRWRQRRTPHGTSLWRLLEVWSNKSIMTAVRREDNQKQKQKRQMNVMAIPSNIKAMEMAEGPTHTSSVARSGSGIRRKQIDITKARRDLKTSQRRLQDTAWGGWKMTYGSAVTFAGCEGAIPEMTKLWSICGTKFKSDASKKGHFITRRTRVLSTGFVSVLKCWNSESRYSVIHDCHYQSCHDLRVPRRVLQGHWQIDSTVLIGQLLVPIQCR